ncbi:glycoside hydrolase family 97 protein [Mucilaginibacter sp. UR6-1]|uniref:glycoside hydrolase family 97 protein n=1 Tax=Mucilaginibacter sp. UR6-1 TaxID=1435643 RepID=UPI001E3D93C5|nr:glycoside hydrolase family 97 protein [Mucilaginibacter sp. UR6-1]MCC8407545.1 glycoside hydrolase family 97 protein [Mucilaginibacter sp. UR6-1]
MKSIYKFCVVMLAMLVSQQLIAQQKSYSVTSPDKKVKVTLSAGRQLSWSLWYDGTQIIQPSVAALKLDGGEVLGNDVKVTADKVIAVNSKFEAYNYKKKFINESYQQLTLSCKGGYSFIVRAYNDGIAYRFVLNKTKPVKVMAEDANFKFADDYKVFIPYAHDPRLKGDYYQTSFEALYNEVPLSKVGVDSLAFLPMLVDLGNGAKAAVLEAGLEDYPGMYVVKNKDEQYALKADFGKYPVKEELRRLNTLVTERGDYIATVNGKAALPWRAVIVAPDDKTLLNNDMVQKLAGPSRIKDIAWIKPGKVAWDWWNDWNISHVDFKAGINTATYKYYVDFASENKLEYVILDEGWSNSVDMTKLNPAVDLHEIITYAKQKNVGIILWATWHGVMANMDGIFKQYADMGAKGFKIDFFDRDDQKVTSSVYKIAETAAKYRLLVDLHGMYKPDGIQRVYPNVLNFEGVKGLENAKWAPDDDVPRYDVSIPFIRMLAGPMDYTPGAMRNANKASYRPINSNPMSQGTRSHQLAMYVIFEAPIQMLADNPTAYRREQESTNFISKVPTVFDETVPLLGKVGEHVAIARRNGDTWYVGAMTNWDARDLEIDLSFLPKGTYEAEIFKDGVNADRDAADYVRELVKVSAGEKLKVHLSSGGGWAARIYPAK